jgi:hypothetical protein
MSIDTQTVNGPPIDVKEHENAHVQFIRSVWQDTLYVDASLISPEVRVLTNTVFMQIQNCSSAFVIMNGTFELFYTATSFIDLVVQLGLSSTLPPPPHIPQWIEALIGTGPSTYRTCVLATALNWKSAMALALLGLFKLTPDGKLELSGAIDPTKINSICVCEQEK